MWRDQTNEVISRLLKSRKHLRSRRRKCFLQIAVENNIVDFTQPAWGWINKKNFHCANEFERNCLPLTTMIKGIINEFLSGKIDHDHFINKRSTNWQVHYSCNQFFHIVQAGISKIFLWLDIFTWRYSSSAVDLQKNIFRIFVAKILRHLLVCCNMLLV